MQSKSVQEALAKVMDKITYLQHDSTMKAGAKYSYASERAFIQAVRPEFQAHGLVIYPYCPEGYQLNMQISVYQTSSGAYMNLASIERCYIIHHHPSGTSMRVHAFGQGADVGDKAIGKAQTNALKYALRQALLLETGDDPDDTPSVTQQRAPDAEMPKGMTKAEQNAWTIKYNEAMKEGHTESGAKEIADRAYYQYKEKESK